LSARRALAIAASLLLGSAAAACAPGGYASSRATDAALSGEHADPRQAFRSDRVDPLLLVEGAQVFDQRCSPCHGERGYGDGVLADALPIRPRNYHAELFKWGTSPSDIVRTIAAGRSGVMPAFEGALSEREMWAAAYLVWNLIPAERRQTDPATVAR